MSNVDNRLEVEVHLDSSPVPQASFTTPMIIDPDAWFDEVIKYYISAKEVSAETKIGQRAKDMALNAFAQSPQPARVGIGRMTSAPTGGVHVIAFDPLIALAPGDSYQFDLQGSPSSQLSPDSQEPLATFLDRLKDDINSTATGASIDLVATVVGDTIEIAWDVTETPDLIDNSVVVDADTYEISYSGGTPTGAALNDLLSASSGWYGFSYPELIEDDPNMHYAFALWADANAKLFGAITEDPALLSTAQAPTSIDALASFSNTFVMYRETPVPAPNQPTLPFQHPAFALMANRLSVSPDTHSTIWSYVSLAGVPAQLHLDGSQINALKERNVNLVSVFSSKPVTAWGVQLDGRKTDLIILKHWLEARVRETVAQLQIDRVAVGSKIPYDDVGLTMLSERVEAVLGNAESIGHIVLDSSRVNMPAYNDIPTADKANRYLAFTFSGVPTGAIEDIKIDGTVSVDADVFA